MVWLDPTRRFVVLGDTLAWLSIQEKEGFVLQQYQPHLDPQQVFCPLDEQRFRVLLGVGDVDLLVAQAVDLSEIICHWEWLEEFVMPHMLMLEDSPEELHQFVILKLTSVAKITANDARRGSALVKDTSPDNFHSESFPTHCLIACRSAHCHSFCATDQGSSLCMQLLERSCLQRGSILKRSSLLLLLR